MLRYRRYVCGVFLIAASAVLCATVAEAAPISRPEFSDSLMRACKTKFQAYVKCREAGNTIWIYLPYTPGRSGFAAAEDKGRELYINYSIASFNPYKSEPPELRFVVQKTLGEIRGLLLECVNPYEFFVLVVSNIDGGPYDDWYIGYYGDIKKYGVGLDFSGEGHSRLVQHKEKVKTEKRRDEEVPLSFRDAEGTHVEYRPMDLKEFAVKQMKWRIYKRFSIEYNKVPFNLSAQERRNEIKHIAQLVFSAYGIKDFDSVYLKDSSFLFEEESYEGSSYKDIMEHRSTGIARPPAF